MDNLDLTQQKNVMEWLDTRPSWMMVCVVLALLLTVFLPASFARSIDGDEGYYLLASRLVATGEQPYQDFFYPQMPFLPYVYGAWMKLTSFSWYAARFFTGILAAVLGVLLYHHVVYHTSRQSLGLVAVVLYSFSILTLEWYTVAKTYTLSTLLLFAAYMCITATKGRLWLYFCSGLLIGLAGETRLFFLGVTPAFLVEIHRQTGPSFWRSKQLIAFLSGVGIALLPSMVAALQAWDTFMFNNVTYHQQRADYGWRVVVHQKSSVARDVLGLTEFPEIQSFLLTAILLSAVWCAFRRREPTLAVLLVVLLWQLSLLPDPTYVQYFSTLVPFTIVSSIEAVHRLRWSSYAFRAAAGYAFLYCVAGSLVLIPQVRLLWSTEPASGWSVPVVRAVSAQMNRQTSAGEEVLTWWPGYFLESHANIVPSLENHFGLAAAVGIEPAQRQRYHLLGQSDVEKHIAEHTARLVLIGNWAWRQSHHHSLLIQAGYVETGSVDDVKFYEYHPTPAQR